MTEAQKIKDRARKLIAMRIKRGKLIRQPCEACCATPAHAHHEDYSKPAEIVWLCQECHSYRHRGDNDYWAQMLAQTQETCAQAIARLFCASGQQVRERRFRTIALDGDIEQPHPSAPSYLLDDDRPVGHAG